jgi:hypothetical protein
MGNPGEEVQVGFFLPVSPVIIIPLSRETAPGAFSLYFRLHFGKLADGGERQSFVAAHVGANGPVEHRPRPIAGKFQIGIIALNWTSSAAKTAGHHHPLIRRPVGQSKSRFTATQEQEHAGGKRIGEKHRDIFTGGEIITPTVAGKENSRADLVCSFHLICHRERDRPELIGNFRVQVGWRGNFCNGIS